MNNKTIITSPEFDYLGDELSKELNIPKADVRIKNFPDWTPHFHIEENDIRDKVATVLLDFSDIKELFRNYALLYWLINYKVEALNIIMPYFPVGTMERKWKPGEVATAHSFANIISSLPTWKSGRKNNLHIFDLHAEVEEYFFNSNRVNVETHSAFDLLKQDKNETIIFPDAWAAKRFEHSFPDNEKVICSKKRIEWERIIEILEWKIDKNNWTIVDDLVQSGWTLAEAAKSLKNMWAKKIDAFATHWVFPNNSHEKLAQNLDKIITTDSIPANIKRAKNIVNFEVMPIKQLIKKIILEY